VGGDGYDFIDLGSGRLAVVLADVSGKGTPGAILWAHLQATIRSRIAEMSGDLAALMRMVNRLFFAATAPEHFATMFLGVYDDRTRVLRYVNCGHNAPLLVRADGGREGLPSTAPALGLMERWTADVGEVSLRPSDTLVVYSDGVSEARRFAGPGQEDEFGEARLAACLDRHRGLTLSDLPSALLSEVEAFAGGEPQDDRTVVVLRGRPQPPIS
jgi:sigma-B regulation protein RsbU (phosphoserine phosphatase)